MVFETSITLVAIEAQSVYDTLWDHGKKERRE